MSNIQAHTFTDTNENEVMRMMKRLKEKFFIHNQEHKGQRMDYLI